MQRSHEFYQWWDPRFHTVLLNVQLPKKIECYAISLCVGSNFITGAPPEFEDLLTLRLCMKPKYNDPNCDVSKRGFTQSDLPNPIRNETSIRMRMTKQ